MLGHTSESLFAIHRSDQNDALMVFKGDTLFAGSVERIDLYGKKAHPIQAEKLYTSIHEKLLPLCGHVIVYPAHGAGSVCGNGIGDRDSSTLGYEKKPKSFLQIDKERLSTAP